MEESGYEVISGKGGNRQTDKLTDRKVYWQAMIFTYKQTFKQTKGERGSQPVCYA